MAFLASLSLHGGLEVAQVNAESIVYLALRSSRGFLRIAKTLQGEKIYRDVAALDTIGNIASQSTFPLMFPLHESMQIFVKNMDGKTEIC
eukprot:2529554-Karenia_brevis.AAC.1